MDIEIPWDFVVLQSEKSLIEPPVRQDTVSNTT